MRDSATTLDLDLPDTCLLYGDNQMFEGHSVQLRPGNPRTRARVITRDGVQLWIYVVRQPYRATFALVQNVFDLAIALRVETPAAHNGVQCGSGTCVELLARQEVEQLVPAGMILEIVTDLPRAKRRGWFSGSNGFRLLDSRWRQHLTALSTRAYANHPANCSGTSRPSREPETTLLDAVEHVLDAGLPPTPAAAGDDNAFDRQRIVAGFARVVADQDCEQGLTVPELAARTGVSERTLYRAFSRHLGVSPYRFVLSWRLHLLRRLLLAAPHDSNAVTTAAARAGFDHLGDMGRHYRRTFGETPRDTLIRSRESRDALTIPVAEAITR